ncbi:hypothetical protein SMD44_07479 [Streptomyces alboflavus]|uniref:Uncharacterized protein n=1 Tax=Streptomyces alboflavus TaxID=67267 RepID=A0A1Z1WNK8_9ACTN|nr:hypothetical protein SMD44_07479 [Streptomyces alboflavus]
MRVMVANPARIVPQPVNPGRQYRSRARAV